MKILIIGGTVFLGRHLVAAALDAGHEVTIFNRGTYLHEEQNEVERLIGDRRCDIAELSGKTWDAVIDTCGMDPETVSITAAVLQNSVDLYVYISSISAFDSFRKVGLTEFDRVKLIPKDEPQDYGSNKAWSEKTVYDTYGKNRALIVRPGLLVGRYDPTDRFTYWPRRIARGGRVLAPGRPERTIQFIDVRDVAEWIIRMIQAKLGGIFCVTGPFDPLSMRDFLYTCREECSANTEFVFIDDEKLSSVDLKPWTEVPLWIPENDLEHIGFMQVNCLRAQNTGLSYRPIAETIEEVLGWDLTRDQNEPLKAGLAEEKERELLSTLVAPH